MIQLPIPQIPANTREYPQMPANTRRLYKRGIPAIPAGYKKGGSICGYRLLYISKDPLSPQYPQYPISV